MSFARRSQAQTPIEDSLLVPLNHEPLGGRGFFHQMGGLDETESEPVSGSTPSKERLLSLDAFRVSLLSSLCKFAYQTSIARYQLLNSHPCGPRRA
jgi:hypothetical protein